MILDSYFSIGSTHEVCEDYTLTGNDSVFLSDGCSSATNTDFGSRLLTTIARKNFPDMRKGVIDYSFSTDDYLNEVIFEAQDIVKNLGLEKDCLFATLLILSSNDINFSFLATGDGAFILGKKNGDIEIITIDFISNAPLYLSYRLNTSYRDYYHMADKGRIIKKYLLTKDSFEEVSNVFYNSTNYKDFYKIEASKEEYRWGIIASDGLFSFIKDNKAVPLEEVCKKLFSFNNFKGNFIKRKLKRFLKNSYKDGIMNYDDISLAGIYDNENNS